MFIIHILQMEKQIHTGSVISLSLDFPYEDWD